MIWRISFHGDRPQNRRVSGKKRPREGRRFKPNESGNPGGRDSSKIPQPGSKGVATRGRHFSFVCWRWKLKHPPVLHVPKKGREKAVPLVSGLHKKGELNGPFADVAKRFSNGCLFLVEVTLARLAPVTCAGERQDAES